MIFRLFSEVEFEVAYPVSLIESYCIQSDFYSSYDLLIPNRKIEDANRIGAHIQRELFPELYKLAAKKVGIYDFDLDNFLALDDIAIKNSIAELDELVIKKIIGHGIGLSKASKILHTIHPKIIPMIDSLLQEEYCRINPQWADDDCRQILLDYYNNLKTLPNLNNLNIVYNAVSDHLPGLTKIRVFDIIWWSYLKAQKLTTEKQIRWSTVRSIPRV